MRWKLLEGDCVEQMRSLPAGCIDAVVTDPPYGIGYDDGKGWDTPRQMIVDSDGLSDEDTFQRFTESWATAALRLLKPGGFMLSFAAARTFPHMAVGVFNSGFELRDMVNWIYGSGMGRSYNLGKVNPDWTGRRTTLKPGNEPIVVVRKPLSEATVPGNIEVHGTGALNAGACAVGDRLPINVVLSHSVDCTDEHCFEGCPQYELREASKFFYCAKPNEEERRSALEVMDPRHPTQKPVDLMCYLVRLVTPPGGIVLDPFTGSGTTGCAAALEGYDFVGIERDPEFVEVARSRIAHWLDRA